jgi:outer membrane translocation and assembly module TamA
VRPGCGFLIRTSGALADHEFAGAGGAASIGNQYMVDQVTGFDGYRSAYGELELRWDTRRTKHESEPRSNFSTGGLISVFAGRSHGLDGTVDFYRYGADAQRFLWLAQGPRVLVARVHVEGVTGSLDEVPFHELPRLGGKDLLRGYGADRFRDRLGVVGSLEYRWDLAKVVSAAAFVDAGRVYRSPGDVGLEDLRVGYGVSLEAHSDNNYLARVSLSSSIDGGVFLDFSLDPVVAVAGRVQRR